MLLTCRAVAQEDGNMDIDILTDAAEAGDDEAAETAEMDCDYIEEISNNKIDINDSIELQSLPILNSLQINDLMEYRKKYGDIKSFGELKGVPSLSTATIKQLMQLTSVNNKPDNRKYTLREMLTKGRHYISSYNKAVLERQAAYVADSMGDTKYNGDRVRWCLKYRYKFKDKIAWGVTGEKDAGESFSFGNRKYGFDYYSMFLKIHNLGIIENAIAGDYVVKFGQGLMLGGGFSMGKSMAVNSSTGCKQLREYSSSNENRFYRGAAATINVFPKAAVTVFASANLVDGTCEDTEFHSLRTDGYHRTERELANKDNLRETLGGMIAEYGAGRWQVGAAAYYYGYDKKFTPREQLRYANAYSTKEGVGASVCYRYGGKKSTLYGETAIDKHGNLATLNAVEMMVADNLRLRLTHRHYSPKYQSFKALSFGQTSRANNEDGIYLGMAAEPEKWLSIEGWADIFRLPWAGAYNKLPASGNEAMLKTTFHASRRYDLTVRLKHKVRHNSELDDGTTKTGYLKVMGTYKPSNFITLATSAQWSKSESTTTQHGYLVCQDVKWRSESVPLTVTARYGLFSAPYAARIYAYENDVSGAFSVPGYYYEGQRLYLTAGYKIGDKATIQIKISRWKYLDRQSVGSGDSEIDADHKSEVSMFFKYNF